MFSEKNEGPRFFTTSEVAAYCAVSNDGVLKWIKAGKMAAYGRDMERDADKGGQILCAAAGYDPIGMSTFLASLAQTERFRQTLEQCGINATLRKRKGADIDAACGQLRLAAR